VPLVEKMLDMARVTPQDYVIDLGSGDGRMVIAAARRGARALGVEYDAQLVAIAQRNAAAEGLSHRARFVQGDMYEADISRATVFALFLSPKNLRRLVYGVPARRSGRPVTDAVHSAAKAAAPGNSRRA
jgi:16S rRNA A1518/A1519 N6-dimethyltransferase RsmA/KsgA/DIM1 with predicted DNA glycosylase/AP lyase activity